MEYNFYIKKYWVKFTEEKELILKPIIRSYCTEDQDSHEPLSGLEEFMLKDKNGNYIKDPKNDQCLEQCDFFLSQQEKTVWKKYIFSLDEIESIMTEYNETKTYFFNGNRKTLVDCYDLLFDMHCCFIPHVCFGYKTYQNSYCSDYCVHIDKVNKEMTFVPTFSDENQQEMLEIMYASTTTEQILSDDIRIEKMNIHNAVIYVSQFFSDYKWKYNLKERDVEFKDYEQFELLHKYNVPEDRYVDDKIDNIFNLLPVK